MVATLNGVNVTKKASKTEIMAVKTTVCVSVVFLALLRDPVPAGNRRHLGHSASVEDLSLPGPVHRPVLRPVLRQLCHLSADVANVQTLSAVTGASSWTQPVDNTDG